MSFCEEINRMYKVCDMMVTYHSKLRDENHLKSLIADISLLSFSVVLTALTFISQPAISHKIYGIKLSYILKFLSLAVFISSLIQLKFDWRSKVTAHADAAKAYFEFKHNLRILRDKKDEIALAEYEEAKKVFSNIGKYNIHVPDEDYLRLKHYHKVKTHISKYLDEHPGSSPLLLKIMLYFRDNIKAISKGINLKTEIPSETNIGLDKEGEVKQEIPPLSEQVLYNYEDIPVKKWYPQGTATLTNTIN